MSKDPPDRVPDRESSAHRVCPTCELKGPYGQTNGEIVSAASLCLTYLASGCRCILARRLLPHHLLPAPSPQRRSLGLEAFLVPGKVFFPPSSVYGSHCVTVLRLQPEVSKPNSGLLFAGVGRSRGSQLESPACASFKGLRFFFFYKLLPTVGHSATSWLLSQLPL